LCHLLDAQARRKRFHYFRPFICQNAPSIPQTMPCPHTPALSNTLKFRNSFHHEHKKK
jgi:hypothetical protein